MGTINLCTSVYPVQSDCGFIRPLSRTWNVTVLTCHGPQKCSNFNPPIYYCLWTGWIGISAGCLPAGTRVGSPGGYTTCLNSLQLLLFALSFVPVEQQVTCEIDTSILGSKVHLPAPPQNNEDPKTWKKLENWKSSDLGVICLETRQCGYVFLVLFSSYFFQKCLKNEVRLLPLPLLCCIFGNKLEMLAKNDEVLDFGF